MKPPCLKHAVYRTLYPHPTEGDPASFSEFVNRCIVPEVRNETVRYYGPIDDLEAKYPGLDYAAPAHRLRLRHFPHHCRLFDAFDRLRLTSWEIYELCKWEGTKNAKDKYMKHNRVAINDTTWDGLKHDTRPRLQPTSYRALHRPRPRPGPAPYVPLYPIASADDLDSPDEDVVAHSVGNTLNQRLRTATAARLRGQPGPLDPAYEQWLKDARERGTIGDFRDIPILHHALPPATPATPGRDRHGGSLIPPYYSQHRRHATLPYEASTYWTRTVPDMFRYGARAGQHPVPPAYPDVSPTGSHSPATSPGRMPLPWASPSAEDRVSRSVAPSPGLPLYPPPDRTRSQHAPSLSGGPSGETRRARRR